MSYESEGLLGSWADALGFRSQVDLWARWNALISHVIRESGTEGLRRLGPEITAELARRGRSAVATTWLQQLASDTAREERRLMGINAPSAGLADNAVWGAR